MEEKNGHRSRYEGFAEGFIASESFINLWFYIVLLCWHVIGTVTIFPCTF